jgi:hypothetical protein
MRFLPGALNTCEVISRLVGGQHVTYCKTMALAENASRVPLPSKEEPLFGISAIMVGTQILC